MELTAVLAVGLLAPSLETRAQRRGGTGSAAPSGFQLDTTTGERIKGRYIDEIAAAIGAAWTRSVIAEIRVTRRRLARRSQQATIEHELLDVVPILPSPAADETHGEDTAPASPGGRT